MSSPCQTVYVVEIGVDYEGATVTRVFPTKEMAIDHAEACLDSLAVFEYIEVTEFVDTLRTATIYSEFGKGVR